MKLLIVDDNPNIRVILKNICAHLFSSMIECEDGDEAVEVFKKENPDWVLMDIMMKRLDGIEAAKKIIRISPNAKIIIISQFSDRAFIDEAIKAGAVRYLNKEELIKIEDIIKENSIN